MTGPACSVLLLAAALAANPVVAQGYKPTRPVEFVVHGGPGGGVDVTTRFVNGVLEKEAWRKYLADNQVEDGFQKGADLARSAQEFIAQRREIFREAGIPMYR